MSSDKRYVLSAVERGSGWALDLGGGGGELGSSLRERGYRYANVDLRPVGSGAVGGDAGNLPFADAAFELVVSSDSLEHFPQPEDALRETRRVLRDRGTLLIWVPFLHPFHGDDLYRYTPLGLRYLLDRAGFRTVSIQAPLGLASLFAQALVTALRRMGLSALERPIERAAAWIDGAVSGGTETGSSFAAAYLVKARPAEAP
ncbi:MAG: class I SAM-dependent methyltransferase [Actinomycetota bacterium]